MKPTLPDARPAGERRHVGSYELVARIGSGGMGEVWRADHVHLPRSAAIKLIQPQLVSRETGDRSDVLVQRFKREAAATAGLRSPHTIQLYDFGITDDGVFFYAMELLEGCTLQQLTDTAGPIPAERTVELLVQVCESLAEAHEAGVIHRDIKPANIFLCKLGVTYDFVKVLDFGLVKFTAGSPLESAQLTGMDASHGTPAFMPPEVVDGSTHFDARSDVYAVGCVAFWLLTGRLVFDVESPIGQIMAHVNEPAPAPSSVTELPVPPALDGLVLRCLSKDPNARPQTAKELLDALRACPLEHPWDQDRARSWWDT
ncbi:MAG: serine/threonine protein kinase, partial [Deltaproteobacteria bacterium]|nr:serine/threonine protein kinase [Deltaproteobacteria bacterium]